MKLAIRKIGYGLVVIVLYPFVAVGFIVGFIVSSIRHVLAALRTGYEDGRKV